MLVSLDDSRLAFHLATRMLFALLLSFSSVTPRFGRAKGKLSIGETINRSNCSLLLFSQLNSFPLVCESSRLSDRKTDRNMSTTCAAADPNLFFRGAPARPTSPASRINCTTRPVLRQAEFHGGGPPLELEEDYPIGSSPVSLPRNWTVRLLVHLARRRSNPSGRKQTREEREPSGPVVVFNLSLIWPSTATKTPPTSNLRFVQLRFAPTQIPTTNKTPLQRLVRPIRSVRNRFDSKEEKVVSTRLDRIVKHRLSLCLLAG